MNTGAGTGDLVGEESLLSEAWPCIKKLSVVTAFLPILPKGSSENCRKTPATFQICQQLQLCIEES